MDIRLTQFSPGAGCGCKIAPRELEAILQGSLQDSPAPFFEKLLVGNESKDDAAVYDIGGNRAIVSTTDFFTPIVDNPFDFGRIAATNAISDIYAMGGMPLMAIAILGWPLDKLPAQVAAQVVSGARAVCTEADIPLAGGHSINSADPIFGLAVTGIVESQHVKRNNSVHEGDLLLLTKPLGIGLISTGIKFGMSTPELQEAALHWMTTLNKVGAQLSHLEGVHALTDVTGFGLMGHCLEMVDQSPFTAILDYNALPKIDGVLELIEKECLPGGTFRNFASYGHRIAYEDGYLRVFGSREQTAPCEMPHFPEKGSVNHIPFALACDPQTSGPLLIAVDPYALTQVQDLCPTATVIGRIVR